MQTNLASWARDTDMGREADAILRRDDRLVGSGTDRDRRMVEPLFRRRRGRDLDQDDAGGGEAVGEVGADLQSGHFRSSKKCEHMKKGRGLHPAFSSSLLCHPLRLQE